jgi:hypothetical protein
MSSAVLTAARDVPVHGMNADDAVFGVNGGDVYDGCRFCVCMVCYNVVMD